ncbi:MAG: DUF2878 family protein [Bryobacterales bacterium]|nr:DUF2878 family protein [Bryobacterales bacterium]
MMRVAVTGISGYLGQALLDALEDDPRIEAVLGLDVRKPWRITPKLTFVRHELGEPGLAALLREHGIRHLFHMAFPLTAPASVPYAEQSAQMQKGLRSILDASLDVLVVASSSVVFGARAENAGTAIAEDAPRRPEPDLPYANLKVLLEDGLNAHATQHPECRIVILRVVTIFGPNVNNFISRTMEKPVITLPVGANPPWQFVHEEDCARAFLTAMYRPVRGTYHIGADHPMRTREILRQIGVPVLRLPYAWLETIADAAWRRGYTRVSENPGCVTAYLEHPPILDNHKFVRDAGFQYRYDCAATFRTFAEARLRGLRWMWLLPLALVIGILAAPVASAGKLLAVLLVTALFYLPLTRGEWLRAAITFGVFFPMDLLSTRQGAFGFLHPDFLGLPYYEPVLWPFLLLTLTRLAPQPPPRFDWLAVPLTVLFAVPFAVIRDPGSLLAAAGFVLAILLARFHTKADGTYLALMIAIGVVWEHVGVGSGQWRYPSEAAAVPLWSSVLWAGVGILTYRLLLPLTEKPLSKAAS